MKLKRRFLEQLKEVVSAGDIFDNPGGGMSTIAGLGEDKLSYIRGSSRMYLPYDAVVDILENFSGKIVSTTDLKERTPSIFDSRHGGHSCNCTMMFSILERMRFTDGSIKGSGRRGSPFFIKIR